jgi:ribA/ribD-fused uncharacterized protein
MSKEKYLLFWGGECSQWYPSKFEIDGKTYNCAEQYMMEQKALTFGDTESAKMIMDATSPRDQKAFGRRVKPFNPKKWTEVSYDIVVKGNIAKFSQNPELLEYLIGTGDIEIVEASPEDRIWGIGLSPTDPRAQDKANWDGLNLLGKAIMDAREFLKAK